MYSDGSLDGRHPVDSPTRLEQTKHKWVTELSPCVSKLISAAQSVVKTLRLAHGIQRLREELPRSAMAHALQHRRDVCFSQAVSLSSFKFCIMMCVH